MGEGQNVGDNLNIFMYVKISTIVNDVWYTNLKMFVATAFQNAF